MAERNSDGGARPTRRTVLKGVMAFAGAGVIGGARVAMAAPLPRLVLTVEAKGLFGVPAVLARAAPLLIREGRSPQGIDLLVADGYRPIGFHGALVSPAALAALPTGRIVALLADPLTAQVNAPPPTRPLDAARLLERLGALLPLVPERNTVVVALRGVNALSEAERTGFEAALAPSTRLILA